MEKIIVGFDTETTGLIKPNVVELEKAARDHRAVYGQAHLPL